MTENDFRQMPKLQQQTPMQTLPAAQLEVPSRLLMYFTVELSQYELKGTIKNNYFILAIISL